MNEGYRFFLIILIAAVSLGLIYYFTNKDRRLAVGLDVSVEGGEAKQEMQQENFEQQQHHMNEMQMHNDDPALKQLKETACNPQNTF